MATSIKIDDTLKDCIQHLVAAKDRAALRDYVEREEAKEIFKAEALASWASYKETGLHLTGQEVDDWLRTWGTHSENEVPKHHK